MLNIKVNEGHVEMTIQGTMPTICADFAIAMKAVYDRLNENPETGHTFKVNMVKGMMDGIFFGEDREHMNHYLAEGDKKYAKVAGRHAEFTTPLDDLIDFLKDKRGILEEIDSESEDDDEAE